VSRNAPTAIIDFETRSACNLKSCGAWVYSTHPTTELLCMVFRMPWWDEGRTSLWHPAFKHLGMEEACETEAVAELFEWIEAGECLEAHNAAFERGIWANVLVPRFGFPTIRIEQWRCSAAKAAAHALPRNLDGAGHALNLYELKDAEGHALMLKLSKPRKPRKKEREAWLTTHATLDGMPTLWHESKEMFERLHAYCRQDVLAEEAVSSTLIDLSPDETAIYTLDQRINERGFQLDMEAPRIALQLIATASTALNAELLSITNGSVSKATQRDKMKAWLRTQGLNLSNTQGATLDRLLALPDDAGDIGPDDTVPWADPADADFLASLSGLPRRALEIVRTLGRSSTAKYRKMLDWAGDDGRVRGGLLYHGASTGRWSGAGVQPHNFPKGSIKGFDMEAAWDALKRGVNPYPDYSIMEVLSCALRGAIVAREGYELYVADFAGIEARGLLWVARDERGLDIFRRHADPYCDMAQDIYDRPITKADKAERSLGKIAVLGLGYQMGWSKFQATCEKFGIVIDDEMAERVVRIYREKFERVKKLWWNTEDAACEAVSRKGVVVKQDRISWIRRDRFLYCVLPSGRQLAYPDPELRKRQTPWGAEKWALTFMGVNSFNRKWQRQTTYGGSLVENIVQAISRDLMAAALQRIEASGTYVPVLSIHDEAIAEAKVGQGDVKEFEGLVATVPAWANNMPIEAEGFKGRRYKK
jgi:DNA polymerase